MFKETKRLTKNFINFEDFSNQNFPDSGLPQQKNISKNVQPQKSIFTKSSNKQNSQQKQSHEILAKISQRIQSMIDHVSLSFKRLLQNLKYLYESNGINFQVEKYYDTLIRLLTPHELLSHFHIVDNRNLFQKINNAEEIECKYKQRLEFNRLKKKQPKSNQINDKMRTSAFSNQKENGKRFTTTMLQPQSDLVWKLAGYAEANPKIQKAQSDYDVSGQKVKQKLALSEVLQKQIIEWIVCNLKQRKPLKMKDIAEKAKMVSRHVKNFKSSISWVTRFLIRYPFLKKMLKCCKIKDFQSLDTLCNWAKDSLGLKHEQYSKDEYERKYFLKEQQNNENQFQINKYGKDEINQEENDKFEEAEFDFESEQINNLGYYETDEFGKISIKNQEIMVVKNQEDSPFSENSESQQYAEQAIAKQDINRKKKQIFSNLEEGKFVQNKDSQIDKRQKLEKGEIGVSKSESNTKRDSTSFKNQVAITANRKFQKDNHHNS